MHPQSTMQEVRAGVIKGGVAYIPKGSKVRIHLLVCPVDFLPCARFAEALLLAFGRFFCGVFSWFRIDLCAAARTCRGGKGAGAHAVFGQENDASVSRLLSAPFFLGFSGLLLGFSPPLGFYFWSCHMHEIISGSSPSPSICSFHLPRVSQGRGALFELEANSVGLVQNVYMAFSDSICSIGIMNLACQSSSFAIQFSQTILYVIILEFIFSIWQRCCNMQSPCRGQVFCTPGHFNCIPSKVVIIVPSRCN